MAYVPGKAGKALADGTVVFPGEGNLDGRAGAAALWVEMSRSGLTPKDEGAFSPLALELQESAYRICKMHDGSLFSYFQEGGGGPGKITKTVHTWVSSKNWKKGEWHLLALAWSPGSIRMSVDGRPFVANNTMPGIADKAARITVIAAAPQEAKVAVAIDELMIFNRPLSNDEINWLWNTMGKYEPLR